MKRLSYISICFIFFLSFAKAQTSLVNNAEELKQAIETVKPGDTLVMANGEWKDVEIEFEAMGTQKKGIVLIAETPGKVKLTGSSVLRIGGDYLTVSGLWFDSGNAGDEHIIRFATDSKHVSNFSRLTNTAITDLNPDEREPTNYYIELRGKNNRVDHCSLSGKLNKGPAIAVRLKEGGDNNHRIDHNYFGERLPLPFNGGETIRIGTSIYSKSASRTLVENNFFENCSGEMEIISVKSGYNIVRNNLVLESEGTITLRHGDNNIVQGNVIIGNNKPKTGGIRIINKGHIVKNNIMIGIAGTGYRSPISVVNGIKNAELNEYDPVVDAFIQNNSIINSSAVTFGAGKDSRKTETAKNTVFSNNLIYNQERGTAIDANDDISGVKFSGNKVSPSIVADGSGFENVDFEMTMANGIPIPTKESSAKLSSTPTRPKVRLDATGALRSNTKVGAIVPGNFKKPLALASEAGVTFLSIADIRERSATREPMKVTVEPGERTLEKAIKNAIGKTTLILKEGVYTVADGFKLNTDLTIKGAGIDKTTVKISDEADEAPQYYFRIESGLTLTLKDLTFDGQFDGETVKYGISSPNKPLKQSYNVFVDGVGFNNFLNTNGGGIYKAYKGTKADSVVFRNSRLRNAYRGLNLANEKEAGKYSAEYVIVENTSFTDIEEFAINYRRETDNPSSEGGHLHIDHCVFYRVDNSEKGRIIETNGLGKVLIQNSVIDNSRSTKSIVRLKGRNQEIRNSVVYNSGEVKLSDKAKSKKLERDNPRWDNLDTFTLKSGSSLRGAGTDNKDIGLIHKNEQNK